MCIHLFVLGVSLIVNIYIWNRCMHLYIDTTLMELLYLNRILTFVYIDLFDCGIPHL